MIPSREQFELWFRKRWPEFEHPTSSAWEAWQAGAAAARERDDPDLTLAYMAGYEKGKDAGRLLERERIAAEFNRRNTGDGWYEPSEPAEIIRGLRP